MAAAAPTLTAVLSKYVNFYNVKSSFPRKRESRAVSGALALGARFRGHDENIGSPYAYFCNEVLGAPSLLAPSEADRPPSEASLTAPGFCFVSG
jgi:hypothetical protein